jgi:hypothetical protein
MQPSPYSLLGVMRSVLLTGVSRGQQSEKFREFEAPANAWQVTVA